MGVVVMFLLLAVGSTFLGIKLVRHGLRPAAAPPIPPMQLTNLDAGDRAYADAARVPGKLGRGIVVSTGIALVAAPWVAIVAVMSALSKVDMTKGRVLRIRNRARLPEPALGDAWAGDRVALVLDVTVDERATLGELWLVTARMEHASVAAFAQLSLHLAALGAPADLVERTHGAALEEIRHARACFAIAQAITGVAHSAGPIPALRATHADIDLIRLAIGSLVDGCVSEGLAADVARHGAAHVDDPHLRATLAMIARDEAGHAELAWDVLAWCLAHDDAAVHDAVAARIEALTNEVTPRMPDLPGTEVARLARYGVIAQDTLGQLATIRIAAVQARARAAVEATQRRVAARAA